MSLKGGLIKDTRPYHQPQGSWVWAKNILISKGFESVTNEEGFELKNTITDKTIIGLINIQNEIVIFSTDNTKSEIGLLDIDGVYSKIIDSIYLNFNTNNPIEGVGKRNYQNDLIVSWCDGLDDTANEPRLLNITNLPFELDVNFEFKYVKNINLTYLSPKLKVPTFKIGDYIDGGDVLLGSLQFAIAYNLTNGDMTSFVAISNTTANDNIIKNTINSDIERGKSIIIEIDNIDTSFKSFTLVVIQKLDTNIDVYEIGNFPIRFSKQTVLYNSQVESTLTLEDVVIPLNTFERVKTMTNLNNELLFGNIKTKTLDYQCYANNISIDFDYYDPNTFVSEINSNITGNIKGDSQHISYIEHIPFENRGFMPSEIYALYISFIFDNGSESEAFHIPGRNPGIGFGVTLTTLLDTINWTVVDTDTNFVALKLTNYSFIDYNIFDNYYAIINDGVNTPQTFRIRNFDVDAEILYLDISLFPFNFTQNSSSTNNLSQIILGESLQGDDYLSRASSITPREQDLIDVNPTVRLQQARSSTYLNTSHTNQNEFYPNTNDFFIKDENDNIIGDLRNQNIRHHRMPSFNKTIIGGKVGVLGLNVSNVHIPQELIDKGVVSYKISYATRNSENSEIAGMGILNPSAFNGTPGVGNYQQSNFYDKSVNSFLPKYDPFYVQVEGEISVANLATGLILPSPYVNEISVIDRFDSLSWRYYPESGIGTNDQHTKLRFGLNYPSSTSSDPADDYRPFVSVHNIRNNVYVPYTNQVLASTNGLFKVTSVGLQPPNQKFLGGDTFLDTHYFNGHVGGTYNLVVHTPTPLSPKFKDNDASYNAVNNIRPLTIYNSLYKTESDLPYRVHRSVKDYDETVTLGWRTFLPNNYYDMPRNKGEIWKLSVLNRDLLIQHKYALFIANIKDILQTNTITAYLGEGDIFDRVPNEVVPENNGYVGCQSQWSAFTCKLGYVVVDRGQGKIFIYSSQGLNEISAKGLNNFFKDSLQTTDDIDNPFIGMGITACYDEEWDRILIVKNIENNIGTGTYDYSYTISYSPSLNNNQGGWIAFHDYIPYAIINSRNKVFSVNTKLGESSLYRHNIKSLKSKFYDGIVYDSYVDVVFLGNDRQTKIWESVHWNSSIIQADNTKNRLETITSILIYNDYQCSGIVVINDNQSWFKKNASGEDEEWSFNSFRDLVEDVNLPFMNLKGELLSSNITNNKSWISKNKFISKFTIVRFIYNNINQKDIYINDVMFQNRVFNK